MCGERALATSVLARASMAFRGSVVRLGFVVRVGMWLALLAVARPARADLHEGRPVGPVGMRTQGVLRELFLDLTIADARAIDAPAVDLRWAMANSWNASMDLTRHQEHSVQLLDEEADSLTLQLRAPWSRLLGSTGPVLPGSARTLWARLASTLELRLTEHWGGWSDRPIEAWHVLTGAFNYERAINPRNRVRLLYADLDGHTAFDLRSARLAFGDLVLRNQLLLADGGEPLSCGSGWQKDAQERLAAEDAKLRTPGIAQPRDERPDPSKAPPCPPGYSRYGLSLRLDLKAPTGLLSRAGGSGGFDAGVALLGTAELTHYLNLHALIGLSHTSPLSAAVTLQPKPWHFTAEVSLEIDFGGFTGLFEDRVLSPLLEPGWDRVPFGGDDGLLSSGLYASFRTHNQLSWAVRWRELTLWLSEDFTPGDNPHSVITVLYVSNSPDVVLGLAWSRQF